MFRSKSCRKLKRSWKGSMRIRENELRDATVKMNNKIDNLNYKKKKIKNKKYKQTIEKLIHHSIYC